jgi:DNA-binding NtrC family response regulator
MAKEDLLKLFVESERLLAQYQMLYLLAVRLCHPLDLQALMKTVTDGFIELFNAPEAYMYVRDGDETYVFPKSGDWGEQVDEVIRKERGDWPDEMIRVNSTLIVPIRELERRTPIAFIVLTEGASALDWKAAEKKLASLSQIVAPATRRALIEEAQRRALRRAREAEAFSGLTGECPAMRAVKTKILQVAKSNASVLIQGETGTGKELVARAIHQNSRRKDARFVAFNCGALPETLIESELFGHVKGAFTGATQDRKGLFRQADGGTLFLDEVGEMPLAQQVKLLRVLQEGEILPLGADQPVAIGVRVVAATNKDLLREAEAGRFRQDLYYRLAEIDAIHLPPLRERGEDIQRLADDFLRREAAGFWLCEETREALAKYDWPGNVRQLENVIKRAVNVANGPITLDHLPIEVARPRLAPPAPAAFVDATIEPIVRQLVEAIAHATHSETRLLRGNETLEALAANEAFTDKVLSGNLSEAREELEKFLIEKTWETYRPNQTRTAEKLGISRTQLVHRLKKLGLI